MDRDLSLIEQFEEHRSRLRAVSYRIVGSGTEADDAVQETWLRLARTDASTIENLGGWLTTVVARVSLDLLKARDGRNGGPVDGDALVDADTEPEEQAVVAEGVGLAMLVVLDTLKPPERLAFVLHDLFGVPFEEIAPIVDRSPDATRQLASRARRRVRGASAGPGGPERRRQVIAAFLNASEHGDFEGLMTLLDPDIVLRADTAAVRLGAPAETRSTDRVAGFFTTTARGAVAALVDGVEEATWAVRGRPRVVFRFDIQDDHITSVELVADRDRIEGLEVEIRA